MENVNVFKTKDFYTAVVLRTLNFPLEKLIRGKGNAVTFVFLDASNKAAQTIKAYWDRKLSIPDARGFVDAISELKTRLYGGAK